MTGRNGYQAEEHTVITADGYILVIFRISSAKCPKFKGTPVLVMHGLLGNSDNFLDAGPGVGYAYLLADDCFDAWFGNVRGNNYGRRHVTLDPDRDRQFWFFSLDEMGICDLPAVIDYILAYTGVAKLNVIGYSQGGGQAVIANSEKVIYNDKINVLILISPATRLTHTNSLFARLITNGFYGAQDLLIATNNQEVLYKGSSVQKFAEYLCRQKSILRIPYQVCLGFLNAIDPFRPIDHISEETIERLYAHLPAGTSVQNLARYAQSLDTDQFMKYDYGSESKNMEKYNRPTPPIYDVSKVTAPVVITFGINDNLTSSIDIAWLKDNLPNVLEFKMVEDPAWTHFDNAYSTNLTTLVYPTVKKYLTLYTF